MQDAENSLDHLLVAALKAQDAALVESLLAQGADADARVQNERQPLFLAVESKNLELVKLVAAQSKDVNIQDDCDFTPFTQAVRLELKDIAHALLDNGASPFPAGKGAGIPLDWAISCKQYGLVLRMLSSQPDALYKGAPVLVYAAEHGDMELAKACLTAGASINLGDAENGYTALHVISRQSNAAEFLRLLIDAGADENKADARGRTPAEWALHAGNEDVFRRVIIEREMRKASVALTEGLQDAMTVRPPIRLATKPRQP